MKQPPYTAPPLVGEGNKTFSLRQMLLGHLASDAYYEAHREDNGVYILWMEFSRFGRLFAYPCVLQERDADPLVFRSGTTEENGALLERWIELVTADSFGRFRFTSLKKEDFQKIYNAYKNREA